MEEAAGTQTIGEGRRSLQDFVAPELRMLAERLDSVRAEQSRLREDIALVRSEAREMDARLHGDVTLVRSELKGDVALLRTEMKEGFALVRAEAREMEGRLTRLMESHTKEILLTLQLATAEQRSEKLQKQLEEHTSAPPAH